MNDAGDIRPEFHRLGLLVGAAALEALEKTAVIVFGLGGVGGWAAEALVRSGVGNLTLVDNDVVCVTNINRQIQAARNTAGLPKAGALLRRLTDIAPGCRARAYNQAFSRETASLFAIERHDYVIDAIDTLTHKLDLIETAQALGIPLFSSMGMACRLDPSRLKTAVIWDTRGCPLARLVRHGLRKRGFTGRFTAVYSDERAASPGGVENVCGTARCFCGTGGVQWCSSKKVINGSCVTVTASAGMILASLVIRDVARRSGGKRAVNG
jgi:tRNA A37 threonylcarbamoyladenosine dehydratase